MKPNTLSPSEKLIIEKLAREHRNWRTLSRHLIKQLGFCPTQREVYDFINGPQALLPCSKEKIFVSYSVGYKFCGPAGKCACAKQHISDKMKGITRTDDEKQKRASTNLLKYGVANQFQRRDIDLKPSSAWEDSVREKRVSTTIERYGVRNPMHSEDVREKLKQSNLERYGVPHTSTLQWTKDKTKNTNLSRYGGPSPNYSQDVKDRTLATLRDRYGVDNPSHLPDVKRKISEKIKNHFYPQVISRAPACSKTDDCYDGVKKYYTFFCNVTQHQYDSRFINGGQILCPKCDIGNLNKLETSFIEFISSIYSGEVIEQSRKIIKPKELDFYLPDKSLAFEINGNYYHSEAFIPADYHLGKTDMAIEKGIRLIHVFEDDWTYRRKQTEQRIAHLLGKSERVFARKCRIVEIDSEQYRIFVQEHHLHGSVNASTRLALMVNDEIVCVMGFGKKRFGKKTTNPSFELLRFCSSKQVIGGASKLFAHFVKLQTAGTEIVSYADRAWGEGNMYEAMGFTKTGSTRPNYSYISVSNTSVRLNRMKFQKKKLNTSMTEREYMAQAGYLRVFDCGSNIYHYTVS